MYHAAAHPRPPWFCFYLDSTGKFPFTERPHDRNRDLVLLRFVHAEFLEGHRCLVCLKTRIDKYHDVRSPRIRHVRLPSCVPLPSPRRRWSHQVPLRMNMNDYRRKNGTGKSEDPKYHDTDDMKVYGNSCNDKHVPLPSPRSREPLPSTLEHARTATSPTVVVRTVPFARFL